MSGPWDKYATKPQPAGPWDKYKAVPAEGESLGTGGGTLQFGPFDTGIKTPEWLDNTLAGVGKAFVDTGRGVGQMVGAVDRKDIEDARKTDAALMETTGGKVGNLIGNVGLLAPTAFIPGVNTYRGAAALGSLVGLIQPSASTGETTTNALMGMAGGVGGQGLANAVGRVAGNRLSHVTQGQNSAALAGERMGMRLTPGKASGSPMLQRVEAAMESNPMTAGGFDAIKQVNATAVNRAAAKSIGETADELSTPILARADTRIGAVFNSVADKTPVPLDPVSVGGKLSTILRDSDGMLMGNAELAQNGLWKRLDNFVNNQGGASREQLRQLSSNLGKAAKNNMTSPNGDRALGEALFKAQEVVEDAIEGTLSAAQKPAYATAREQYRNLMLLTAKTNVVNPSSGQVSGRGLANALMQKDRGGFTMGRNSSDMYDAARFVQAHPSIVGDSGTATRSMGPTDWLMGIPGNLLSRAYLSRPVIEAARLGGGGVGLAAQLANPLTNALARPLGVVGGNSLAAHFLEQ